MKRRSRSLSNFDESTFYTFLGATVRTDNGDIEQLPAEKKMKVFSCQRIHFHELEDDADSDPAVVQAWKEILGNTSPLLNSLVARALLSCGKACEVKEKPSPVCLPLPLLRLVFSSSARVSQVTYQTVIDVRYPELVTRTTAGWNFGRFVSHNKLLEEDFFLSSGMSHVHAVSDIGAVVEWLSDMQIFHADAKSSLAVLHDRNTMVSLFRASNWKGHANFCASTDKEFVQMLATNCCLAGPNFPQSIAEVLQDCVANHHKVRRLHLIVVDL